MEHIRTHLSAHDIGIALHAAGMLPYVKDLNTYGIYSEGDEYEVFTERLPEVYLRKQVPTETFEFQEHPWILACLEQAADQLGQACEVLLREDAQHDLDAVTEQLSDPTPDNPWLQGQIES